MIGVPLASTSLDGLDALLATVQMPAGVPVATVAIGPAGAENAAILAAQILALREPRAARSGSRSSRSSWPQSVEGKNAAAAEEALP